MSSTRFKSAFVTLAALLLGTACENSTAPPKIDPAVLTGATAQIAASLEAPVTRSLGSLSAYLAQLRSIGSLTPPLAAARIGSVGFGARLVARLAPGAAVGPLPDTLWGKTLEFSCASGTYATTARPGAPAQAVRFILYATGSSGGSIACPPAELGHADFADTTWSGQPALHVIAADRAGTPYVDVVAANTAPGSGTTSLTASGTVSDGTRPLPVGVSLNFATSGADFTGTAIVTLGDAASAMEVHIRDDVAIQNGAGTENITFTLRASGQTAALTGTNSISSTGSSLDLMLNVDGRSFARVGGSFGEPSFTAPDGEALTADDMALAKAIFQAPIAIFSDVGRILTPPEILLGVGS